jgi:hypothetical protein
LVACVDAGVLGRVAKDAARLGLYDIRAKSDGGVEFARDLILTGSPADVAAAKALFARNDALAKRPEAERLQRAREAADPKADAVVYFVKDSIFRAPVYGANFDPRVFLNAGAIRYAFAEIAFQAERVAMRLVLEPLSGKRVTAVSPAPAGSFVTRALAGGESAVYLAWRPDRAAELSPLLLGRFGADDMKEYQKKLALLMLNTFFDCAGHEFAVSVPRGGSTDSPALVFQLAKKTEMIDLLSKLSKTAQAEAAALGAAIGPNGATLDDVLEALKTDAGLAKLTALANDEQRAKLQDAARRVRRGDLDPKTLLRSAERVYMFGRYWHWRVAGDLLVLSASPEQAEYVVERLGKAGAPAPSGVPADGVALANVDLATLLREWLRDQPAIAEWLRDHPATVTLGAKEEGGRLTASGTLMSDRPAGAP